jgi:phosphate transport system substrate-binding protein
MNVTVYIKKQLMINMKKSLIAIATLILAACGNKAGDANKESGTGQLTGEVKIDGSSTVYPITEAVAEEFMAVQPDVKVTIGLSGTGGGFKKFGRGETDINNASAKISEKQIALCKENNIDFVELMVAYDGLAVLVNPQNTWVDKLTVAELKMIWEPEAQGKITKWNQIRPEWPNEEIHLYGAGVESGTYDYFTEAIVGKAHSSRGDYTGSEDDNVLVQGIAGDKFALGFFGLAYYEENKDKLKLVPVDNGTGAITPSMETVMNGTYAPLSRPLFIYVNSVAAKRNEVISFVNFYMDNAPELTKAVGYVPLQPDQYATEKKKFTDFAQPQAK